MMRFTFFSAVSRADAFPARHSIFVLNTVSGWDRITDFNPIDDTIAFDRWGYWNYNGANGDLLYDSDGDFSHDAVQVAILAINLTLTNADFTTF